MQIVFTDPPRRNGPSRHHWGNIAEQLKQHPGQWALCLRGIYAQATSINRGMVNAFKPAGTFQARVVPDGGKDEKGRATVDLYIRYLGDKDADEWDAINEGNRQ